MAYSEQDKKYMLLAWRIVGEFGFIIVVPVVFLALLGKYMDERYNSRPLFLIVGFILAAVLSAISIYRRAKHFGRQYQAIETGRQKASVSQLDKSRNEEK